MNWFKFCSDNFGWGNATIENLKIYVFRNKITESQYEEITGVEYVAA